MSVEDIVPWIVVSAIAVAIWFASRAYMRRHLAHEAERALGASFADFALEVLANAAKLDGRIDESERQTITDIMSQATGAPYARAEVDAALKRAGLGHDQLVAYLATHANKFTNAQKLTLLKGVLSVAMADGHFDQREHDVYLAYIQAVGFERQGAPDMLRGIVRDLAAGKYS